MHYNNSALRVAPGIRYRIGGDASGQLLHPRRQSHADGLEYSGAGARGVGPQPKAFALLLIFDTSLPQTACWQCIITIARCAWHQEFVTGSAVMPQANCCTRGGR